MPGRRQALAKLGHRLEQDRGLKVLAVAIALLLWLQAVTERNPLEERAFTNLSVRYTEADAGLVILSADPPAVNLVARGRTAVLQRVAREDFQVYVDLAGAGPGVEEREIRVSPPRGVEVARLSVEAATVWLDRLAEKEMPIRVVVRGIPAEGHAVREALVSPASVVVSGATSRLDRAAQAVVELDAEGAASDLLRHAAVTVLAAGSEPLTGVEITPPIVEVVLPVFRLPGPVTLPVDVRLEGTAEPGYEVVDVVVTPPEVRVRAEPADLQLVQSVWTSRVVVTGQRETFTRNVSLERPAGAYLVDPPHVTVRVEIRPLAVSRTLEALPVEVVNLGQHFRPGVFPDRVQVTVGGVPADLEALATGVIRVTVDALGLAPGSHRLPVRVELPAGLTLEAVKPAEVTVEIRP
ncbi:MAG: CdaR family protein [bacterium]|nr:CdaR family protein [bacterium]